MDCSPPVSSVHWILQARIWSGLPFPSCICICICVCVYIYIYIYIPYIYISCVAWPIHLFTCVYICTYIGEGNGNPLQCSCQENPMDRGAWWAIVHGVAKSWYMFWSSDASSWHIGKGPNARRDWGQRKKALEDEVAGWRYWYNGHELGQTSGDGERQRPGELQSMGSQSRTWLDDWTPTIHVYLCACVLSFFSYVRLCDLLDCSPSGSSVHGALQARILEWVAMPFSRGSS